MRLLHKEISKEGGRVTMIPEDAGGLPAHAMLLRLLREPFSTPRPPSTPSRRREAPRAAAAAALQHRAGRRSPRLRAPTLHPHPSACRASVQRQRGADAAR